MITNFDQNDIQQTKALAWLSYVGILFLIPMLVNKNSPYTKFHVNQGIILLIATVILGIARSSIGWIPVVGWVISTAVGLITFGLMIFGIINSLQGSAIKLPIIGNFEIYK